MYKIRAATGLAPGRIKAIINTQLALDRVEYDFDEQIEIQGFDEEYIHLNSFAEPDDSGSLVIDTETNEAIGLLFAGNGDGYV